MAASQRMNLIEVSRCEFSTWCSAYLKCVVQFNMWICDELFLLWIFSLSFYLLMSVKFLVIGLVIWAKLMGWFIKLFLWSAAGGSAMRYSVGDASKLMSFTPILNGLELQPPPSDALKSSLPFKSNLASKVCFFEYLFILGQWDTNICEQSTLFFFYLLASLI